ncbi:GEVED domain-containing protein [Cytophagaceae bacterium ABcell3]|nr:GEVED domain-containing protein [Cytophagaceae bacterium ABcell3]
MPKFDVEKVKAEARKLGKGKYYQFGHSLKLEKGLEDAGEWTSLPNGDRLWRLGIRSEGAFSINLILSKYKLPEGASLFIYNADRSEVLGAFSSRINQDDGKLGIMPVSGEEIYLEYYEPANVAGKGQLVVGQVIHAFEDVFTKMKSFGGFGDSGDCNMNVNCPDGADWEKEKRAVSLVLAGGGLCSGALINNTANDGTPYILTADHCLVSGGDVSTWVFAFNYESPDCSDQDGPSNYTVSGASLKARDEVSDFLLLEMNSKAPEHYNVFYAGWSREKTAPSSTVSIHHPSGDIKKISFDDSPADGEHLGYPDMWEVQWDRNTTTEAGSSGAPLFDENHRIIGQLYGGTASCSRADGVDYYGKFYVSWNGGGITYRRLMDWLDPVNSGAMFHDGMEANERQQYCVSEASNEQNSLIQRVTIGGSLDTSFSENCRTYTDNSSLVNEVYESFELGVYTGTCGLSNSQKIKVYVDWNNNFDFGDEGELVVETGELSSGSDFSSMIDVPEHAVPNSRVRMRVIVWEHAHDTDVSACGNYSYGETQDYTLRIGSGPVDAVPEITSVSPAMGVRGSKVTIEGVFNGITSVTFNGNEAYFNVLSENTIEATIPYNDPIGTLAVTNAAGTAEYEHIFYAIHPYCNSRAISDEDAIINSVKFGDINTSLNNNCRTYSDFYDEFAEVYHGQEIELEVGLASCQNDYSRRVKVYIDWNGDGVYNDHDELVSTSPNLSHFQTTYTTTVRVPNATAKVLGMRIICWETEYVSGEVAACGYYPYGETHDYVLINKEPAIVGNREKKVVVKNANIFNYPNPFNGHTTFKVSLEEPQHVRLEVLNMLGQIVGVVADQTVSAGEHEFEFNSPGLQTGTYLYRLSGEGINITKKMICY